MAINKVGSKGIEDGSVATADFAPGTVTSSKLQDNAVTNAKLTNSSVTLAGSSVSLGGSVSFNNKFVDWQSVITADGSTGTTAVSGRGYFIDTTSAAHTITLPASASIGDFISIKDYAGTFATNNLTIARNGHNIQGIANNSLISTNRASLVLVYVDSTKGWLYWEEHNVADLQKILYVTATGGTVTTSGNFKIHTFTGDGSFVVSCAGNPVGSTQVDYLVVAGGGGGAFAAGGGGAGGFRESHSTPVSGSYTASPLATPVGITVSATTYPITIGGGGSAETYTAAGGNGNNSVFSTITSAGGGGGSNYTGGFGPYPVTGILGGPGNGGSGGGGGGICLSASPIAGGTGNTPPVSPPQGNPGGSGSPRPAASAGGGGGATETGSNASGPKAGGRGGTGATTSISGSPIAYAGGGGAGGDNRTNNPESPISAGAGSPCGTGGAGGYQGGPGPTPGNGTSGTVNRGGGAGAGGGGGPCNPGTTWFGGSGGKGIVIIRYKFQ